ncbi:choice-of-anchor L domain-containing protein [Falsirhodobacter xinxiangensis]|uniref:choice-of-anchor L domain-containing protein n=1 Tax=Falsirhodobacter xinxiangensis TaxID=2530049 RepID=UPI00319E3561
MVKAVKLPVVTNVNATQMANAIFGSGTKVISAKYSGDAASKGIYSNGLATSPGVLPSDTGVILSTGRADAFTTAANTANKTNASTNTLGADNNPYLNAIAGTATHDAAVFEATFVPDGSVLTMQIVFASEEYPEYVGGKFNDAVGIYVNGVRAELTVGNGDISINNINATGANRGLFKDNANGAYNTEMDGFTVTLTLKAPVKPGVNNTIWIGIADAGDSTYDSNLVIAGKSVQTSIVAQDDEIALKQGATGIVDVLANDIGPLKTALTITHINGVPVKAGDSVTLASGTVVRLLPNGTLAITSAGNGPEVISYTTSDGSAASDTGFVNVATIACFTAGTRLETPGGARRIEDLRPGDMVLTRDDGPQPLRWIGTSTVAAEGRFAPNAIAPNALGRHDAIELSPNHRILIEGHRAELLFGEGEALAKARDLVNDLTVTRRTGGNVTYVHVLFDRHQIVTANGLDSES